jgi:hypothetical protein
LSGAAALPGSASTDNKAQTIKLVMHQTASHRLGKYMFAGTDRAKSGGKFAGYDTISGRFFPKANKVRIQVAFALNGGILLARVSEHGSTPQTIKYRGPILGGSGNFAGVTGRITAHSPASDQTTTYVTLTYSP